MNGRRDYAASLSDSNDARALDYSERSEAFLLMKIMAALGIAGVVMGNFIVAAIFFGVAFVVGLLNW